MGHLLRREIVRKKVRDYIKKQPGKLYNITIQTYQKRHDVYRYASTPSGLEYNPASYIFVQGIKETNVNKMTESELVLASAAIDQQKIYEDRLSKSEELMKKKEAYTWLLYKDAKAWADKINDLNKEYGI